MSPPPGTTSDGRPASPARQDFLQRLDALAIKPAARDYYVRWAEAWINALGHRSAQRTQAFFNALGRTAHLADWQKHQGPEVFWTQRSEAHRARRRAAPPSQFRQAVDAVRILAREILSIPCRRFHHHDLSARHQTPGSGRP